MLCAAIALSAEKVRAFSLQGYEGDVQLGEWQGSLEGAYLFENQTSRSQGSPSISETRDRFDEVMKIKNNGFYLIDPRLLTGDAGLDLDLYQEQDRYSHSGGAYMDGLLWGYNFDTTFFPQSPENVTVYANQNQGVGNTTFGGHTTTDSSNYGLLAQVLEDSFLKDHGVYYFSSRLSVRQEEFDEKTTQLGSTFQLDQTRDIVDYTAEKGFQTADLKFKYEFDDEDDTGTDHLNFQTQLASLRYSLDFGPNLNRNWSSDINYYDRTGTGGQQRNLFVNEQLRIDHNENLFSTYQYQLQDLDTQDQGSTLYQYGLFELNHRWYRNINQILDLGGLRQTISGGGDTTSYWIGGSNAYSRALPWQGNFFLNTNGQYEITDNNIPSGLVPVIDESHIAPLNDTPFALNNTFVLTNTIVVVDTRGGSRLPTQLNIDYDVIEIGNQTQIKRVPTSLVIQPGDPLAVSYTYQVPSSARYSTTTKEVTVGVTFPWIDLAYSYDSITETLLSGQGAQFLQDETTNTGTVGVHHDWETFAARANATYETVDSSNVSFNMTDLMQNISYQAPWSLLLSASGDETLTNYTSPRHRSRSYVLQLNGDRPFWGGGTLSTFASLRILQDSAIATQTAINAGMRVKYVYGKLQFTPSILWYDTTWGTVKSTDLRLEIRVSRFLN
jgi:hypothetical protein